jgi:hypothetical protein
MEGGCVGAGNVQLNILGGLDDELDQDEGTSFMHHRRHFQGQTKKLTKVGERKVKKT